MQSNEMRREKNMSQFKLAVSFKPFLLVSYLRV